MGISIKIEEIANNVFNIETSGRISSIITNTDRDKFGLSDERLQNAVELHKGKRTTDVFLCSPTPWRMYSTHKIEQTVKIIEVEKTKVVGVRSQPVIIKRQTVENKNPSVSITVSTDIEETIANTVSFTWKNENNLSVSQSIGYDIKALRGETSLSYSHSWGSAGTKSKSVTFRSGSSNQMTLSPGQSATVELKAVKKIVEIEITYKCYLEGNVASNFNERYDGHMLVFHFTPIENVLEAGGIDNSVIVTELIKLELYSDSIITVN